MLNLTEMHAYYGASHVLQGVTLEVGENEVVALLGRNGVGKTTTIRTIMGLTKQSGAISFHGNDILASTTWQRSRLGIGYVPEDRRIITGLTVGENLTVANSGSVRRSPWNLDRIYERFPILRERRKQLATTLSGGEQQMLTIARALMSNPSVMLLDEPSQGLSPLMVATLAQIIRDIHASGLAILLVEQNFRMAIELASRAYVLNKGRVVYQGSAAELASENSPAQRYLAI
ncbi:MAG: ABC transporter ATP-binding protein [Rhodospirillales bacterium]